MTNEIDGPAARGVAMPPWPALAPYGRTLRAAGSADGLFLYDTASRTGPVPAIVLIHGLGDEADSWRHVIPLLAATYRVLAPDLPGFGRSVSRRPSAFARHTAAVTALLGEVDRAVLVGSSMGAAVAEAVAFAAPEKAVGLVLLDGGLPSGAALTGETARMLTPIRGERAYRAYRKDHEAAYRSLEPYYADLAALPEAERIFLRERVIARVESERQLRAYFSSLRSLVVTAALRAAWFGRELSSYPGPVLIGWGERDRIMPPASAEPLMAARRDARFVAFGGAGHLPHQEAPLAVAEAIAAFASPL